MSEYKNILDDETGIVLGRGARMFARECLIGLYRDSNINEKVFRKHMINLGYSKAYIDRFV